MEKWNYCRRISLVFALQFFVSLYLLSAQNQALYFSHLNIEDGLPSNNVSAIAQDSAGFIWIGTQEGLCRYDCYKMELFQKQTLLASLPSSRISTLLIDGNTLWVGTWDGLCTIDIKTFKVQRINIGTSKSIRTLFKDKEDKIWIGTGNGLFSYDKILNQYKFYNSDNSQLSHNTVRCFYQADNGIIWIGTYDGLNSFNGKTFNSYNLKGEYNQSLSNNLILSMCPYGQGNDSLLWVGTETGLSLFNTFTGTSTLYNLSNTELSNEVIKTIHNDGDKLWLGTDFGLNIFDPKTKQTTTHYNNPIINHTITNNVIWDIFEDSKNLLWFVTTNGISLLNNNPLPFSIHEEFYTEKEQIAGNLLRDMLVTPEGFIWLATIHGVVRKNLRTGKRKMFTTESPTKERLLLDNTFSLARDKNGRIWIATAGGINIWDELEQKMHAISANKDNGLLSNYINNFAVLDDGSIYLCAWEGGLFKVTGDIQGLSNIKFKLVDKHGSGTLMACGSELFYSDEYGVWKIDQRTLEKKRIEVLVNALGDNMITCVNADTDHQIWIGSTDFILHFNTLNNTVDRIPVKLSENVKMLSVEKDSGYLWVSTPHSIVKIKLDTNENVVYPLNPNAPLKSFLSQCSTSDAKGLIFFGGINGYVELNPMVKRNAHILPTVYLTGLHVNNRVVDMDNRLQLLNADIAYTGSLNLKYNSNSLTFDFSLLDYWLPKRSSFKYRLTNHHEQWQYTSGTKNFAVYSNLKPGIYQFQVIGIDHMGLESAHPLTFNITINPSIWFSNLFILMYVLLALFVTYIIFRIYGYRQRLNTKLKMMQLDKIHSEQILHAKQQFFTNVSHEFRTPLSLIVPPIQQVLKVGDIDEKSRKMLTLASKNSQRLLQLVNQILDFRKQEISVVKASKTEVDLVQLAQTVYSSFSDMATRNEISYDFITLGESLLTYADTDKIETALYNLLSNAFKHTPVLGKISMKIWGENEMVYIQVKDNGKGIPASEQKKVFDRFYQTDLNSNFKAGSGIGLTMALEYAKLHGGNIHLVSDTDKGCSFTVRLPMTIYSESTTPRTEYISQKKNDNTKSLEITGKQVNPSSASSDLKKILIVDDNPEILEYIELNLQDRFHLIKAKDGEEGLELALAHLPNIIVSDVMMPNMDGYQLCEHIKANAKTLHIPVILLTAKNLDTQKNEGMKSGADMYVTKPFDTDYLQSCIQSIFRRDMIIAEYIKQNQLLNPNNTPDTNNNQDEIFLKKVMSLIETNLDNPAFTVESLSSEIGISSTHLYRRLKTLTNKSTKDIIKNYRLQKAAQMLQNNEGNITEIMYAVGFSSLSSFSKSFKAHHGKSPNNFG